MYAVPAFVFLAAAIVCSLVSRILLIHAAYAVSTRWLFTVLFAPFGPLVFGLKYGEAAKSSWYPRMLVGPLVILFFLDGGNTESLRTFMTFGKPNAVQASAGDTNFHLSVPDKVVTAAVGKDGKSAGGDPPTPATPTPTPTSAAKVASASPTPAATPSAAVAAAIAAMPSAPKILSPAERIEANRREFERLAEWYNNLKRERGYLRKGDAAAIEAYNAEAAQYQTALQLAKTEQASLNKLTAKK